MKVLYIYKRFDHHSAHSGYDQITKYIPSTHYTPGKIYRFISKRKKESFRFIREIDPEWYNFENFALELELLFRINLVRKTIFHVLYGENFYRFLGYAPFRRGNRVVVSFHQPPTVFPRAIKKISQVTRADSVFVVGSNQVDYFREMTGRDNIFLVPHGIDTEFFSPPQRHDWDGPLRCISVGWWLRDVDTIKKVIKTINQIKNCHIEFHIVTFDWCHKFYEGLENVYLYSNVPDHALREMYQNSHLLLLPLNDCTANNAVLESMACGLPVFSSEAGSIRDYIGPDSGGVLAPRKSANYLIDALLDVYKNRDKLAEMGKKARERALKFSWPTIAKEMIDYYRKIL